MVTRVLPDRFGVIVKGKTQIDWNPGEAVRTRVNGQDVRFTFVDHPETAPEHRRKLAGMAKKVGVSQNGIGKAYFNEKHGQLCVDVASNVRDPLGAMERAKKGGNTVQEKINVRQPYRVRPMKKRSR